MWGAFGTSLFFLGVAHLLARGFLGTHHRPTTYWFLEHALINFVLTVLSLPGLKASWNDPTSSLDVRLYGSQTMQGSSFPMILAFMLHLYHGLLYSVSAADAMHHLVFVTFLTLPGCLYEWGALANAQLFFMCGLPGGLTYFLLAMQRTGRCLWLPEPAVTACLHVFLRTPGVLACASCMIDIFLAHDGTLPNQAIPMWAILFQIFLAPLNGIYYAHDSVLRWRRKRVSS